MSAESISPEPTERYQYKTFPDNQSFRLLCLFPPRGDRGIECSLIIAEFPFERSPLPYEAISYAWGAPSDKVNIICDGRLLAITASLEDALRRARRAQYTRILWADGVCINQEDIQERISQVQKMALIYLRARRVLAWIGHDEEAETASRLITKLKPVFETALEDKDDLYLCETIPHSDQADLEIVVRMFRRPLFSRVWIIQELGVASEILFLFGNSEIQGVDLLYFINCMVGSQDLYQLEHHTDYERFYSAFMSFRPIFYEDEQLPDFLEVLLLAQNHGASNDRDHVFALLGHPSAYINGSPIIRSDYAKPVSEIYTQLSTQLLLQDESLRPLSAVYHGDSKFDETLPTWVPALYKTSPVNQFGIDQRFYYNADSAFGNGDIFRRISDRGIAVRGLLFDSVRSSSALFPAGGIATEPETMKVFRNALDLSQSEAVYEAGKCLEAFGLTMTAGLIEYSAAEDAITQHRANFSAYLTKVYNTERNRGFQRALARDQMLVEDFMKEAANGEVYKFARDANVAWNGRRFFCTSRGFFGLGPKVLKKNDLCCVLFGARVPFILRKVDNYFLLVGECYIQGIMHGEAIDMWRKGKLQEQEFELH